MNWGLIGWFAGTLLTIYGIVFVFTAIRTLLSKETMNSAIEAMGGSIKQTNKKFQRYLKRKVADQRQKAKETKPVVTIR